MTASQISGLTAAVSCEGALNPVVTRCIPAAQTIALQTGGKIGTDEDDDPNAVALLLQNDDDDDPNGIIPIALLGVATGITLGTIALVRRHNNHHHHHHDVRTPSVPAGGGGGAPPWWP